MPMRSLTLPPGIARLELAVELDVDALGEDPREPDHRRAADVVGNVDRD
jgi:hypothetical protein